MFENLQKIFEEFGLAAGSIYCADRLCRRLSPRLRLYYYELMMQPTNKKPLLSNAMSRAYVAKEILPGQSEIELMPVRAEVISLRFKQHARCLGLYKKEQLVGYVWLRMGHYIEDEVRCDFELLPKEQSSFDFDLYIFPKYRMGPAFAALWDAISLFLREQGIEQSFSRMTRFNTASRRAHLRMGSVRIGRAIFLHAFGLQLMMATVPKYLHGSLNRAGRANLVLRRP